MTSGPSTIVRPACHHLGTTHDAAVHCGYATRENVCYAGGRRRSINLEFQETHCLGGPYEDCIRYQETGGADTAITSPSPDLVAPVEEDVRVRGVAWRPLLLGAAGVIAVAFLAFLLFRPSAAPASSGTPVTDPTAVATTVQAALVIPTSEPAATNTPAPPATATSRPAPTNTATQRPSPTATSTKPPTAGGTVSVTTTATITPTAAITGPILTTADIVNVREGPGVAYRVLGVLPSGQQWPVQGRDASSGWVQGCCITGLPGWVSTQFVTVSVPISELPVITVLPPVTTTVGITATVTITP